MKAVANESYFYRHPARAISWHKCGIALAAVSIITSSTAVNGADESTSSAPPASAHVLIGGLRHSEKLPPLPDELSPGQIFTESAKAVEKRTESAPVSRTSDPKPQELKNQSAVSSVRAKSSTSLKSIPDASDQLRSYLRLQSKSGNFGTYGLNNYLKSEAHSGNGAQPNKRFGNVKSLAPRHSNQVDSRDEMGHVDQLGRLLKFQIPGWIAGVWQRAYSTELTRVELPSGKSEKSAGKTVSKSRDSFGTYRDGRGVIWQVFDPSKATGVVDRGENVDHHTVHTYKIENTSPTQVTVKIGATHVVVNKVTHKIVTSYQDEELNQFTKIDANHLRTDSSVKVFDSTGKPHLLITSTSTEDRIAHL